MLKHCFVLVKYSLLHKPWGLTHLSSAYKTRMGDQVVADILKVRIKQAIRQMVRENADTPEARVRESLAEKAGVSLQAVGLWINTGKISMDNLLVVADVLKKSTDWLLGRTDEKMADNVVALHQEGPIANLVAVAETMNVYKQYELLGRAKEMALTEHAAAKANPVKS